MIDYLNPNFDDRPGLLGAPRMYDRLVAHESREPAVSVITPYYNTEALFVETFLSLKAQSLQNWEWLIVDDGSTDEASVLRLKEVASKDPRITVFRQENAGPAAARNTGFRNSSGRYVCLLDSDDLIESTYLEKCVWFLESNPEFSFCNTYSVVFGDQRYLWTTGFERGKDHLRANSGPPISVIRREAFSDCGGFDESIRFGHEDWDFWLAMAKSGHWGYTIPEFRQWYRKRGEGRFEQIMKTEGVNDEFEKLMRRKYSDLEKSFPSPSRRHPTPYEAISQHSPVSNKLKENPDGRRIMFLIPWMVTGGADRVNLDLIEGLVEKGHDVTVCATLSTDHRWEHEFARLTPDVFVLPNFLHISDYPRFLSYLIKSRQIDSVVVTGSTIGYQLLPYLRATSPGVAFIDMCHVEEPHWLNGGHPRFSVGYQDLLDLNVTTTQNLADWMQTNGADGSRIRVMYTGVRAAELSAHDRGVRRETLGLPADVPVIVFAGRLCEQKRPLMLVEILRRIRDRGAIFKSLIIGDGELKSQVERLVEEYELSGCVSLLGSVSHGRWLEVLSSSDILLMPSKYEGISIALLESMAAGVVPVVAKVGGQEEMVGEFSGVLISNSGDEIGEYVQVLMDLLGAPPRLQAMSDHCKGVARTSLSWEFMVNKFLGILDEAHRVRATSPRHEISTKFGVEMASLAFEYKRLGDAVDWLWNLKQGSPSASVTDSESALLSLGDAQAAVKVAVALSQTGFGRRLLRNGLVRFVGRRVLAKLAH
jgi:glycosyltransferase involved in cell wall biosynthesis